MVNGNIKMPLEIVQYSPALEGWFERLNLEWLERYFVVEAIDKKVLRNPEQEILRNGGCVLFGRHSGDIVGTCAIKHHGDGVYELIKMAVTADAQGQGFGRALLQAAIDEYRKLQGKQLFLESHHSLDAALKLYETGGFRQVPRPPGPAAYVRSDVYMVFDESFNQ